MRLDPGTGQAARPSTVDTRRRMTLPTVLADAAGITAGPVVVLRGERRGELVVATPAAAMARLRTGLADAVGRHGVHPTLAAALYDGLGRATPGPPTGAQASLPGDGPIICDATPLLALLDNAPAADPLVDLLPRLVVTEAVADELFTVLLAAGLTMANISAQLDGFEQVMDILTALGLRTAGLDAEWAPVRVLEYELRKAGGLADAERATLALAAHLGAPALLGGPVGELPATVTVHAVDYRDLEPAPPTGAPVMATPA